MTTDYEVLETLFTGTYAEVSRCRHVGTGEKVVIKTLRYGTTLGERVARLRHEFNILQLLQQAGVHGVPMPLALLEADGIFSLVTRDMGGLSMAMLRAGRHEPVTLPTVLSVAVQVARTLMEVHGLHVLHKDITPRNVVYNAETGQAQLIDFGLAMQVSRGAIVDHVGSAEGTLTHMAPEQTGRLGAPVDRRTDLFGLGATLYDLLTGRPPVLPQDSAVMVHEVITTMPPPIQDLAPDVPAPVAQLVTRLLDRDPRARYRSAYGLHADLLRCQRALHDTGVIAPFTLAERDPSDTLTLPDVLLGQEEALDSLQKAIGESPGQQARLLILSGDEGGGKSSLIAALQKRSDDASGGLFAVARHAEAGAGLGLEGIAGALGQLVRDILQESTDRFDVWRRRLQEAMGGIGQVLIDLVPSVRAVVGDQPALAALGPNEAANRLLVVLHRVFTTLARHERLVVCIDDADRVDSMTLRLLRQLAEPATERLDLTLIVAVDALALQQRSPLTEWLEQRDPAPQRVSLRAMSRAEVATWLERSMEMQPGEADSLADITFKKTAGNPQALRLFVGDLWQSQLVHFDLQRGCMTWDAAQVARTAVSANVADALLARLDHLSAACLRVLGHAACVGLHFGEADLLAALGTVADGSHRQELLIAAEEGLTVPFDENGVGRFTHEVVRASAAERLDAEQARYVHGRLVRHYRAHKPKQPDPGWFIALADHLNQAEPQLVAELGQKAAEINRVAAYLLVVRLNFARAQSYADEAARLLKMLNIQIDNAVAEVSFVVSLQGSCRIATNDAAGAERLLEDELVAAKTATGRARIFQLLCMLLWHMGRHEDSIIVTLRSLAEQNEKISSNPSWLPVMWATWRFRWAMKRRGLTPQKLAELPAMTDKSAFRKLYALQGLLLPASIVRPRLMVWGAFRLAQLFVEHGPDPGAAPALTTPMYLAASRGDFATATAWIAAIRKLAARHSPGGTSPYVEFYASLQVECLQEHPLVMLERYSTLQQRLFEMGDYGSAAMAAFANIFSALPFSLEATVKKIAEARNFVPITTNPDLVRELNCMGIVTRLFQGGKVSAAEREMLYNKQRHQAQPLLARCTQVDMLLLHLVSRNMSALQEALKLLYAKNAVVSTQQALVYEAFACCLGGTVVALEDARRRELKRMASYYLPRLERAARMPGSRSPCMLSLVQAQMAALEGSTSKALRLYDKSVAEARQANEVGCHALAFEYAGRLQLRLGMATLGLESLRQAGLMYQIWGIPLKSGELQREADALMGGRALAQGTLGQAGRDVTDDAFRTIESLIEVNQQLSGVYDVDTILRRVAAFVAGWVGDGRVLLLAYDSSPPRVVADTAPKTALPQFLLDRPPPRALWTVGNVVGDPTTRGEAYFHDWSAGVCMFMPVMFHGEVSAGIYCDNRDALALSQALMNNLELVADQTAVALGSAAVFDQLEAEVESRTREFRDAQAELDRLQFDDAEIQMASGFAHEMRSAVASARFALAAMTRLDDNELVPVWEELQGALAQALAAVDAEDAAGVGQAFEQLKELQGYFDTLFDNVREGVDRAVSVTGQVLEYANAGQIVVGDHHIAIDAMLDELVGGVTADLSANGIGLQIAGDTGVQLPMREEHAFAVMRNLLANARDAVCSKPGSAERRIVVTVEPDPQTVRVRVEDTGIGMSQATQDRVFQPFFTTKGASGTGLGLGLSRKLVRLYGGDLIFSSREGEGTVFSFTVPRVGK